MAFKFMYKHLTAMDRYQIECRFLMAHEELVKSTVKRDELREAYAEACRQEETLYTPRLERTELERDCGLALDFDPSVHDPVTPETPETIDLCDTNITLETLNRNALDALDALTQIDQAVDERRADCAKLRDQLVSLTEKKTVA